MVNNGKRLLQNTWHKQRCLRQWFYPDKNRAAGAEEKFKEVAEVYEDAKKRKDYDIYGEVDLKGDSVSGGVVGGGTT